MAAEMDHLKLLFIFIYLFIDNHVSGPANNFNNANNFTSIDAKHAVLKAGQDQITVAWSYNQTYPSGTDSTYKTMKVKLCYSPISQVDRSWRKTNDDLSKDKTCQFNIISGPYNSTSGNSSFTWTIRKDIPTATYFVRAYAYNADGVEAAYGQTTNPQKTTGLFEVTGISGRHVSLDVASICFSAFSIVVLFGFFYIEKRKAE